MSWLIIAIVVALVGGIIYLSWKPAARPKSRKEFFTILTKYLHGEQKVLEGAADGIQVEFIYQKQAFVYEEIETLGFKQAAYKGFLKAKSGTPFTLYLTERKAQRIIRAGFDSGSNSKDKPVNLPQSLHTYNGYTNDSDGAAEFLKDPKVEQIWNSYKSLDMNGYPFMSLKIFNGEVILEFNSAGRVHPDLNGLRSDIPSIEVHIDRIVTLINKMKNIQEQQRRKFQ